MSPLIFPAIQGNDCSDELAPDSLHRHSFYEIVAIGALSTHFPGLEVVEVGNSALIPLGAYIADTRLIEDVFD